MELIWNEAPAERLKKSANTQLRVSGELPSPDGSKVADTAGISAKVIIESASVKENEIEVEGKVAAAVTAFNEKGELFSYESSADFENVIKAEGVSTGMRAHITTCVQSISAAPSENGVMMNADVDIGITVVSDKPIKVIAGVSRVPDLETRIVKVPVSRNRKLGSAVLRLREELAAEDVLKVISNEGQIAVRDVTIEQGGATVSGIMTVSGVTVSSEGNIGQLVRQIPFRERVEISGIGNSPYCTAALEGLYMRSLGEEFAMISLEAEVKFEVFCIDEEETELPCDVFSPTIPFDCLFEKETILSGRSLASYQSSIRETVTLNDSLADVAEPLFANAFPVITEVNASNGALEISGVFVTSLAYKSTAGKIYSFTEDVPFSSSFDIPEEADLPIVEASCIAGIAVGNTRSVQIQYHLQVNAEIYKTVEKNVVVGLAETEKSEAPCGIVICFASEGEDVFDIAKRCRVSSESVRKLNPDVKEPFNEGEKLLLFV